ncbi:hypothetical protein D9611_002925 [Ephemerocybe angulata]|uniref:Guanine nucleotide-binding protein-like 3 N-terminal domain-containing protein n=1 Tax=Ephemerocybe angulata TaxID=980116 RepID=A0A8H5C8N2_9AGAR|nr:hypothetical protein D9611_002925 [Tulosesus angulatus]
MPSIRKKTSNRLKIHDRERLKKRVKDSKKKKSKAAKKNPQWKSKDKDPGIPNDFPYKDQILAEVAQQRRADAEEKERKKEEKRLARLAAKGITPTEPEGTTVSDDDDSRRLMPWPWRWVAYHGDDPEFPFMGKNLPYGAKKAKKIASFLLRTVGCRVVLRLSTGQ